MTLTEFALLQEGGRSMAADLLRRIETKISLMERLLAKQADEEDGKPVDDGEPY